VEGKKLTLPESIQVGDITVRDGLQVLEHYYPAELKVRLAEDLILAGFKDLEITNFGHPKFLPQFKDVEEVLDRLFQSARVGHLLQQNGGEVAIHVITINEKSLTRALEYKATRGYGPDYVLQMVSTDEAHHRVNAGMSLADYWKMTERCTAMAHEAGMKMCGTVSTIWGSPMEGTRVTDLSSAVEFSKIYLDLGADYIEQADHDGSADPQRVYEYFTMILDPDITGEWSDPKYHLAHFHTSRGMGLANYLAALQAGITQFESTVGSVGGQPANMMDCAFIGGTGGYYHKEHLLSGLVSTEDFVVMCEAMGIDTGIDVLELLDIGRRFVTDFLDISPQQRQQMLENVHALTGVAVERLARLGDTTEELEQMKREAADFAIKPDEEKPERVRRNVSMALESLAGYLKRRRFGHARSESTVSGPPPSPNLEHLL